MIFGSTGDLNVIKNVWESKEFEAMKAMPVGGGRGGGDTNEILNNENIIYNMGVSIESLLDTFDISFRIANSVKVVSKERGGGGGRRRRGRGPGERGGRSLEGAWTSEHLKSPLQETFACYKYALVHPESSKMMSPEGNGVGFGAVSPAATSPEVHTPSLPLYRLQGSLVQLVGGMDPLGVFGEYSDASDEKESDGDGSSHDNNKNESDCDGDDEDNSGDKSINDNDDINQNDMENNNSHILDDTDDDDDAAVINGDKTDQKESRDDSVDVGNGSKSSNRSEIGEVDPIHKNSKKDKEYHNSSDEELTAHWQLFLEVRAIPYYSIVDDAGVIVTVEVVIVAVGIVVDGVIVVVVIAKIIIFVAMPLFL